MQAALGLAGGGSRRRRRLFIPFRPGQVEIIVLVIGAALGTINGLLSYRLQGQALILTLGLGFANLGQINPEAFLWEPHAAKISTR